MIKNFEDMQKLGQSNVDSAVRMFGEWNKNWQAIAAQLSDYTKHSFQEGTAALEKLMSSKSVEQAVEIQTNYAKRACDDYMQQMNKIGGMYATMAKEAYKPVEHTLPRMSGELALSRKRISAPAVRALGLNAQHWDMVSWELGRRQ